MAPPAAVVLHLRRPFLLYVSQHHLFSSFASPSYRPQPSPHPRALRSLGSSPADADAADDGRGGFGPDAGLSNAGAARSDSSPKKSRNELKREAARAVRWGMELSKFSPSQIKRVLRAASLEREVFNALMLVKRFGPDVREGRRRQFNYIGRLLRSAEPELMDTVIHATKDGDDSRLLALLGEYTSSTEDDEVEDITYEEEGNEEYMEIATRWYGGLIGKDPSITNEVYAVCNVEFDRQELRKLVRTVHKIQDGNLINDGGQDSNAKLSRAKRPLLQFLRFLAKVAYVE